MSDMHGAYLELIDKKQLKIMEELRVCLARGNRCSADDRVRAEILTQPDRVVFRWGEPQRFVEAVVIQVSPPIADDGERDDPLWGIIIEDMVLLINRDRGFGITVSGPYLTLRWGAMGGKLTSVSMIAITVDRVVDLSLGTDDLPSQITDADFEAMEDFGDLFTLEEFIDSCRAGSFNDYDGSGYYADSTRLTRIRALPSDVAEEIAPIKIKRGIKEGKITHVAWFNK